MEDETMTDHEPMTDEDEANEIVHNASAWYFTEEYMADQAREIEQLKAEIAAMRTIVESVADIENSDGSACYVTCDLTLYDSKSPDEGTHHNEPCLIEQARAYLAAHPATATVVTAKSEGE